MAKLTYKFDTITGSSLRQPWALCGTEAGDVFVMNQADGTLARIPYQSLTPDPNPVDLKQTEVNPSGMPYYRVAAGSEDSGGDIMVLTYDGYPQGAQAMFYVPGGTGTPRALITDSLAFLDVVEGYYNAEGVVGEAECWFAVGTTNPGNSEGPVNIAWWPLDPYDEQESDGYIPILSSPQGIAMAHGMMSGETDRFYVTNQATPPSVVSINLWKTAPPPFPITGPELGVPGPIAAPAFIKENTPFVFACSGFNIVRIAHSSGQIVDPALTGFGLNPRRIVSRDNNYLVGDMFILYSNDKIARVEQFASAVDPDPIQWAPMRGCTDLCFAQSLGGGPEYLYVASPAQNSVTRITIIDQDEGKDSTPADLRRQLLQQRRQARLAHKRGAANSVGQ